MVDIALSRQSAFTALSLFVALTLGCKRPLDDLCKDGGCDTAKSQAKKAECEGDECDAVDSPVMVAGAKLLAPVCKEEISGSESQIFCRLEDPSNPGVKVTSDGTNESIFSLFTNFNDPLTAAKELAPDDSPWQYIFKLPSSAALGAQPKSMLRIKVPRRLLIDSLM